MPPSRPPQPKQLFNRIGFALLLLAVFLQILLANNFNSFLRIYEAFNAQPNGYALFIVSLLQSKAFLLLPPSELILGYWLMFRQPQTAAKLLMVLAVFLITAVFYGAAYQPAMLIR